jgi:hypothetical protein
MITMNTFNHNIKTPINIISIQYIINTIIQCINIVHQYFMWKPNAGENRRMFLLFIKEYIHRKQQHPISPATTGRRLQPPIYRLQPKGSSNSLIYQLQSERGYNPLSLLHPTGLKYNCRVPICHYLCHCN